MIGTPVPVPDIWFIAPKQKAVRRETFPTNGLLIEAKPLESIMVLFEAVVHILVHCGQGVIH